MDRSSASIGNRRVVAAVTFVLWLATVAVGLFTVYALRQVLLGLIALGGAEYQIIETAGLWILCLLAPLYIAFFIFTAEYHRKHVGQPASWKLFAVTIAVEAVILALYLLTVSRA